MRVDDLIRVTLRARQEARPHREVAGGQRFRASEIGYCLQQQMLSVLGAQANVPDDQSLGIFEAGHALAAKYCKLFLEAGVLLKPPGFDENPETEWAMHDDEWRIGAHVDFIIAPNLDAAQALTDRTLQEQQVWSEFGAFPVTGVELKSMGTKGVQYSLDKHQPVAKEHQLLQAAAYDLLAAKTGFRPHGHEVKRWIVLVEDKDKQTRHESEVEQSHRDEVLRRLEVLNTCYEAGTLPDCSCWRDWNGRYKSYCKFWTGSGECCAAAAKTLEKVA